MVTHIEPLLELKEIVPLLAECGLPVSDISSSQSPHFFGIRSESGLLAVIGVELFGAAALLRSLAVLPTCRGLARELVVFVERFAAEQGVEFIFLLTTTASELFAKLGFVTVPRVTAPSAIQATPQFSGLCPASSAFLGKAVAKLSNDRCPVNIRVLLETDNVHYSALWRNALVEQDIFFRISIEDEPTPQIQTKFTNESFTLGAFVNSELVGTVSLERDPRSKMKHKALLFRMFVHPFASGQGIGKALVNEAMSLAKNIAGLRQVNLTVLATNKRAISLYSSAEFAVFSHEIGAVKIGKNYIDELQMVSFIITSNSVA